MNGLTRDIGRESSRPWLIFLVRWAAGLLILAVLIYFLPFNQLRGALSGIAAVRFAALLAMYLLALLLGATKWHITVNAADSHLPFIVSAECYAGGLFGALFLPSIVGGDVVRLAVGISRSPRPASVVTGNFVDRLLDLAAQLTLLLLGLVLIRKPLPHIVTMPAHPVAILATAAAFCGLALWITLARLLPGRSVRFRRRIAQVDLARRAVLKRPYRILFSWLLGVGVQGTFLVVAALLGRSCGLHLPFAVWLLAWPLSKLAAILPLTQGGIGIRETALVALLVPFGAPAAQVLATGVASEGVIIAGGLIAGLAAFVLRRLERGSVLPSSARGEKSDA